MPEANGDAALVKAKPFFERAEDVAATENYDYAIEMYLEGLRRAPDALEEGHFKLRAMALIRQGRGGKKPSIVEKVKRSRGKEPLDRMLNAGYLLAKDPDNLSYADAMLKAAAAGGYNKVTEWLADLIFEANRGAEKPSLQSYILVKESYKAAEKFEKAISALRYIVEMKPGDGELDDELRSLSAQMTMKRGKYGTGNDFRDSIKDREAQAILHAQDSVIKTDDFKRIAVEEAKKNIKANPDLVKPVADLANALMALGTQESYDEAKEELSSAYGKFKDFSLKQLQNELEIKYLGRKIALAKSMLAEKPADQAVKKRLGALMKQLACVELDHYQSCVENYPTDLRMRYEYGIRLLRDKKYDEAIPMFQESQREPRRRMQSLDKMAVCFFMKGWYGDAIDIFTRAIESYEVQDDAIAKELRYNLARSYEQDGNTEKATEIYRGIAQLDFSYKDVRQRVEKLREQGKDKTSQS